ncbi:hypothetical protein [Luteimonas salinilitoris]|uniref:Uncharacterized protein n=1 Tax=Luteimonas salinilitoris TaxID=3237697 RepID=A0ABV4HV10_9GAMM
MTEETDKPTNPLGEGLTRSERVFVRIALLQTLLAVIGIVTGSIALYAGLTEADAARKQQEAAVWPMLQMAINDYDVEAKEPIFRIMARNSGSGPARIAGFRVTVGGEVQSDWNETFTTLAGSHEGVLRSYFSGRVISAGEGGRRRAGTGRDRARGVAKSVRRTDLAVGMGGGDLAAKYFRVELERLATLAAEAETGHDLQHRSSFHLQATRRADERMRTRGLAGVTGCHTVV